MPSALPTPYDITPLPIFAFEPGVREWLGFVVLVLAIMTVVSFIARRARRNSPIEAFSFALAELMTLRRESERDLSKERLARASLIVKRLASALSGSPIAQFSPNELREYARSASNSSLSPLLLRVVELDSFKYQPDGATLPSSAALGELISLVEKLEQEVRSQK